MKYEYKCTNEECGLVTEHIQSMSADRPDSIECPACHKPAKPKLSAPAIVGARKNESIDAAVGRDAESKWTRINARQAERDKVRRESGQVGLAATSPSSFTPISSTQKETRTRVADSVVRDGYKQDPSELR